MPESVIAIVSSADNGDSDDSRRWLGRTAAAFLSQWEKVTRQCSEFRQIMTRVKAKPWTGSPEDEDFVRTVTAIRNRSCEFFNLYSVLRSASYFAGKTFPFVDAYHRTTLLPNLSRYFPPQFGKSPDAYSTTNGWGSASFAPKAKAIVWNGRSLLNACPQFFGV
jgi:hypothetical protein